MSSVNFDVSINSVVALKDAAAQQKVAVAVAQKAQEATKSSGNAVLSLLGQAVEMAQQLATQNHVDAVA